MADQLPKEHAPPRMKTWPRVGDDEEAYYVCLASGSPIDGPHVTLTEALDVNPQTCQGGLYAAQTHFTVSKGGVKTTFVPLYTWQAGAQKWVRKD